MFKYILITFAFLGFAFYQLSGGADFNADELRLSRINQAPIQNASLQSGSSQSDAPIVAQSNEDSTESRTLFVAEVTQQNTIDTLSVAPAVLNVASQEESAGQFEAIQSSLVQNGNQEEPENTLILPSLIPQEQDANGPTVSFTETVARNLRVVTGNRVNVRGGPNTTHSVVGKLTRGAQVEILTDNGNGWVEMRTADGSVTGWMADFLLNDN